MLRLTLALGLVNALLMMPAWLAASVAEGRAAEAGAAVGASGWIALEGVLLVGLLALLPRRRWSIALAWTTAVGVVLTALIGLADVAFLVSLARPLNLFIDLYPLSAVYNLAVGNAGLATTLLGVLALLLTLLLSSFALARLLAPPDTTVRPERTRRELGPRLAGLSLVALSVLGLTLGGSPASHDHLATPVFNLTRTQGGLLAETWRERSRFGDELATLDSYARVPGLLSKLEGRDVVLTFIESYGVAALDDPEFARVVRPSLDSLAARAEAAGIHLVSGRVTSPTTGGQSWYAHGTMISGLWLSNQLRYELLLASPRETLIDDFRRAGYRTAALMPAITMGWPDGVRLGYDRVHTAENIFYGGPPLYWVTMPDQFTWSYLEHTVRANGPGSPLFVEAAMVSSHAPWTPILPMVDWEQIGDGSRFESFRQEGHPPEELWIDIDVLRTQYAKSIDYSVRAMTGYVERYLDERTLLIVLGDHQAAPWVTGAQSAEVPMHVFARDPSVLEPFLEWGFVPGATPNPNVAPHRMDEFRDWFVHAYSNRGGHS